MTPDDKVNILMVDDQPAKLLSYEVILADLGENLIKAYVRQDRPSISSSKTMSPSSSWTSACPNSTASSWPT